MLLKNVEDTTKTRRQQKRLYNSKKKIREKNKRHEKVQEEIQKIKDSNLVKNFSSEEIPDEAYLYLSLGSTFSSTVPPKKHDYVFDAKEFCRKLAWSSYHEEKKKEMATKDLCELSKLFEDGEENEEEGDFLGFENGEEAKPKSSWAIPKKLKIKSRRLPDFKNNLLTHVTENIKNAVKNIVMPKKHRRNLTILEANGQKWCRKMTSERKIYITRVDKGAVSSSSMLVL